MKIPKEIRKAELSMLDLAKIGITALIDEATGYQEERFKDKDALLKVLVKNKKKELNYKRTTRKGETTKKQKGL